MGVLLGNLSNIKLSNIFDILSPTINIQTLANTSLTLALYYHASLNSNYYHHIIMALICISYEAKSSPVMQYAFMILAATPFYMESSLLPHRNEPYEADPII